MDVYTMGIWQVKSGRESAFIAAWWDLATWTSREFLAVDTVDGVLLSDAGQAGRFVSFGPWASRAQIAAWRSHPGFVSRVTAMKRDLLDSFTASVLDVVPQPDLEG